MTEETNVLDPVEIVTKAKVKIGKIPSNEFELLNLSKKVADKWATSTIKLLWISKEEFNDYVTMFDTAISEKNTAKAQRTPLNNQLKKVEDKISKGIEIVKNYLQELYGKDIAKTYYKEFGITKEIHTYKLSKNQEACKQSLEMVLKALVAHKLTDNLYGLTFWTQVRDEYFQIANDTIIKTGNVSLYMGQKNLAKEQIVKTLNSLMLSIKANYPTTYKNEYRIWGFQKERFK